MKILVPDTGFGSQEHLLCFCLSVPGSWMRDYLSAKKTVQCYFVPDWCVPELFFFDDASHWWYVPWMMCPSTTHPFLSGRYVGIGLVGTLEAGGQAYLQSMFRDGWAKLRFLRVAGRTPEETQVSASSCCAYPPSVRGPGSGHIDRGRIVQGKTHLSRVLIGMAPRK